MTNQLSLALELARRFLTWWIAELAACVPSLIRSRLAPADALVLSLGGDLAVLSHETASKSRPLTELPVPPADTAAEGSAAVRRALRRDAALEQRFNRGKLPIVIRLSADQGMRTPVTLPAGVETDLRQALLFQLDRRTPFAADNVHFAHRIVRRDEDSKQIHVDLAVVPRTVVAEAVAAGERLGLHASAVQLAGASLAEGPSENLLPDQERARRRPMTMVVRAAAAVGILAALFAIYRPVHVAQQTADALRVRVEAAKAAADKARHMKEEVAKLTEAGRFLVNAKRENPSATEVLYQLTHVLPDDTWLEQLTLKTGEVYISGYSKSASALIPLLGDSGLFLEPRFRSAVMQDPTKGKERFQISAKIVRRSMS